MGWTGWVGSVVRLDRRNYLNIAVQYVWYGALTSPLRNVGGFSYAFKLWFGRRNGLLRVCLVQVEHRFLGLWKMGTRDGVSCALRRQSRARHTHGRPSAYPLVSPLRLTSSILTFVPPARLSAGPLRPLTLRIRPPPPRHTTPPHTYISSITPCFPISLLYFLPRSFLTLTSYPSYHHPLPSYASNLLPHFCFTLQRT